MSRPSLLLSSIGTTLIRIDATQPTLKATRNGVRLIRHIDRRYRKRDSVERHARTIVMLGLHSVTNQLTGIH